MKILITKQNIPFFQAIKKDLKIEESTITTSIITCSPATFQKFYDEIKALGHNPYALMVW